MHWREDQSDEMEAFMVMGQERERKIARALKVGHRRSMLNLVGRMSGSGSSVAASGDRQLAGAVGVRRSHITRTNLESPERHHPGTSRDAGQTWAGPELCSLWKGPFEQVCRMAQAEASDHGFSDIDLSYGSGLRRSNSGAERLVNMLLFREH